MILEASAIHMSYAHYLGSYVRKSVSQGLNPFQAEYFTVISGYGKRDDILNDENPAIVMATSGMLEGGPSVEYFKELAPNPKNKIIFVSRIRPKRVLVNHGEKSKSENVASSIYSRLKIRSGVPDNREIVRLR